MKRRWVPFVLLAAAASLHAEQRTLTPGPFDRLQVSGATRIELSQGDRDQVTVTGDERTVSKVRLVLDNSRLTIVTEDDWKFWNRDPVQLKVQMREITRVTISGASDIVARTPIRSEDLRIDISGQGEVRLSQLNARRLRFTISGAGEGEIGGGAVVDLQLMVSGKGKFSADKLKATKGTVTISGVGNADVWVTDDLRVVCSGVGTVNYWGNPRLRQDISAIATINAKGQK